MAAIKVPNQSNPEEKPRIVSPEEVASYILLEVKKQAEKYCGCTIKHCIITCPVIFDALQRKATMEAGYLAGFDIVELITEPCAAAVAYALRFDPNPDKEHHYLVYDLGGGTFDVSVVKRSKNTFRVIRTGGDDHLGGKDVDLKLMAAVEERMENTSLKLKKNGKLLFKMRSKQAKESLSEVDSVTLDDVVNCRRAPAVDPKFADRSAFTSYVSCEGCGKTA